MQILLSEKSKSPYIRVIVSLEGKWKDDYVDTMIVRFRMVHNSHIFLKRTYLVLIQLSGKPGSRKCERLMQ